MIRILEGFIFILIDNPNNQCRKFWTYDMIQIKHEQYKETDCLVHGNTLEPTGQRKFGREV